MLMELGIIKKAVLKRLRNGKSEPYIYPYHYVEFLLRNGKATYANAASSLNN